MIARIYKLLADAIEHSRHASARTLRMVRMAIARFQALTTCRAAA